jgi:hypothetical protein
MSLAIDIEKVWAVKFGGEWIDVMWKGGCSTFTIDSYEYVVGDTRPQHVVHGGGDNDVCAVGFTFHHGFLPRWISGPLTAIEAVAT